jgi:uncharacterized protein (DUF697 family)
MTDQATLSDVTEKEARASAIVRSNMGWSAGAGLLPLPGLDIAAIIGVQVNMLRQIAQVYEVPFKTNIVKELVAVLISGGGTVLVGGAAGSLVKSVPIIGTIAGMLTMPAVAAATTWATGRVFIRHFESGGTFLDFDPAKARAHYAEEFATAKAEKV